MAATPRSRTDVPQPARLARHAAPEEAAARLARRAFPGPAPPSRRDAALVARVMERDVLPWPTLVGAVAVSGGLWALMAFVALQAMRLLGA